MRRGDVSYKESKLAGGYALGLGVYRDKESSAMWIDIRYVLEVIFTILYEMRLVR